MSHKYPGGVWYDGYDLELAKQSVGKGWHQLLEKVFAAKPTDARIVQVKEKFARLTIYFHAPEDVEVKGDLASLNVDINPNSPASFLAFRPGTPVGYEGFAKTVRQAEEESLTICEDCGQPGTPGPRKPGSYWMLTLCPDCRGKDVR